MDVKDHWKPLQVSENAAQAAEMTSVNFFSLPSLLQPRMLPKNLYSVETHY